MSKKLSREFFWPEASPFPRLLSFFSSANPSDPVTHPALPLLWRELSDVDLSAFDLSHVGEVDFSRARFFQGYVSWRRSSVGLVMFQPSDGSIVGRWWENWGSIWAIVGDRVVGLGFDVELWDVSGYPKLLGRSVNIAGIAWV